MRAAHFRTLAAQSIAVSGKLRVPGLETYEAIANRDTRVLIFSGSLLGPSWASIGRLLEIHELQFSIVQLGRPYLLAKDTPRLRSLLHLARSVSRISHRDEVFIKDEGFLESKLRKKFDLRVLIAPALALIATVALGANFLREPVPVQDTQLQPTIISCALEMTGREFTLWLGEQISTREAVSTNQLVIQTDLGVIELAVDQALGSTLFMRGSFSCDDGRSKHLKFRTDALQRGYIVEIGPGLDP